MLYQNPQEKVQHVLQSGACQKLQSMGHGPGTLKPEAMTGIQNNRKGHVDRRQCCNQLVGTSRDHLQIPRYVWATL